MDPYGSLSQWFWDHEFWLPPNVTWEDVNTKSSTRGITYAEFSHLAYPLAIGLMLCVVRMGVEGLLFRPLGRLIGIKHHRPNRLK